MRRFSVIFSAVVSATVLVLFGSSFSPGTAEPGGSRADKETPSFRDSNKREYDPDRMIVKLKEGASSEALERKNRERGARTEKKIPRTRLNVVDLPQDLPVEEAVSSYEAEPEVEYAEPDYILKPTQTTANDPSYPRLYGLNNTGQNGGVADADVDAPEAWGITTGNTETVVAVIDEGVDISHPDLRNNLWVNPGEVAGNRVDDDRNGYVDDVNGYDFANDDASVYDPDAVSGVGDEHGTHVAGTIAAEGNNKLGVVGVNWRARIMSLKFLGPDGGYTSDAVEALNYAVSKGARISNNSWGGGGYSQTLHEAIKRADAAGHLMVAAAGNGGADGVGDDNDATPNYPSNYDSPNIISVAATDSRDTLASFSNYGAGTVDIAAPGVNILSTLPGNTYGSYSGTSMATPHVAGLAALLKSQSPNMDDAQLKARILDSVEKKSSLQSKTATEGRLNAAQALNSQSPPLAAAPTVESVEPEDGATRVRRATDVTVTFSTEMNGDTLTESNVELVNTRTGAREQSAVTTDGKVVTLDPSAAKLAKKTKYKVTIKGGPDGARDSENNAPLASDKVWYFTTGRK